MAPGSAGDPSRKDGPFISGSQALLCAIVQSASDAIVGMDLRGTILSWNDSAQRLLGHNASEMTGVFVSRHIPYDLRDAEAARLARIAAGEILAPYESRRLARNGEEVPVIVTLSPVFDKGGAVIAASYIMREAPNRKRRQKADAGDAFATGANAVPAHPILVVEDEALIGLGLAAMLENAGFNVVGPTGDVRTALDLLDRHDCALAILDVNLGSGETSEPLAERLKAEGIPFFVSSGYSAEQHPPIFAGAPTFPKPAGASKIVAAVQEALAA